MMTILNNLKISFSSSAVNAIFEVNKYRKIGNKN
jgi:hypothetical protein